MCKRLMVVAGVSDVILIQTGQPIERWQLSAVVRSGGCPSSTAPQPQAEEAAATSRRRRRRSPLLSTPSPRQPGARSPWPCGCASFDVAARAGAATPPPPPHQTDAPALDMHARFQQPSSMAASRGGALCFFSSSVAVASGRRSKRMMVVSCGGGGTTRTTAADVYSSLAAKVLGPPTSFNASKLKVEFAFAGEDSFPRAYTLTHCDFTANLTLAVTSGPMSSEQLRSWQSTLQRDDVVAEWKEVAGGTGEEMSLHVHCFVSGANLLQELAAGIRYYVFSKELPLVLNAVVHGDAALFAERPELMEAKVWVHFHSSSRKYNRIECWGTLREAATQQLRVRNHHLNNLLDLDELMQSAITNKSSSNNNNRRRRRRRTNKWASPETIFNALLALLL